MERAGQNNHKRGLAIVAEELLELEEVMGRHHAKQVATAKPSGAPAASMGAIPKRVG
jgi:hypothetical protein